jgi:hypothetical protein|tara:strand:+ start:73 stop:237 length:165 start_codon:yes stop_codon:yes gene_type:complete
MPKYEKYPNETPGQAKKRIAKNKADDAWKTFIKKKKKVKYEAGDDYNDYVVSGE